MRPELLMTHGLCFQSGGGDALHPFHRKETEDQNGELLKSSKCAEQGLNLHGCLLPRAWRSCSCFFPDVQAESHASLMTASVF